MTPDTTILLVDDDEDQRTVIGTFLLSAGFQVEFASSSEAAQSALQSKKIDVIVADICMPQVNGLELSTTVTDSDTPIPVILITASSIVDPETAQAHGAAALCDKKDVNRTLIPEIRTALRLGKL